MIAKALGKLYQDVAATAKGSSLLSELSKVLFFLFECYDVPF